MSTNLQYWIQRHDYSAIERESVSASEAKRAFREFDWEAELDAYVEDDPAKNCPPGIGINNGLNLDELGAKLLHICPIDQNTVFLNIHFTYKTKLLGLIPTTESPVHFVNPYDKAGVDRLIDLFYADDREALFDI